jgi:hypothetical protein
VVISGLRHYDGAMLNLVGGARAKILHALLALALAGCATIASGPHGEYLDAEGKPSAQAAKAAKLRVSAREMTTMSSRYFTELEFTFENPTAEWVRVEKIGLDFGGEKTNQAISLPWGSQLESWAEATHQRNVIRAINDQIALELIGAGVMLSAAATSHSPAAGAAPAGGMMALTAAAITASDSARAPEGRPTFNGRHLLALPLEVPPGLFLRRYLIVNTPQAPELPCLNSVTMTYEVSDKSTHRVAVSFRSRNNNASEWQANVCPRDEM